MMPRRRTAIRPQHFLSAWIEARLLPLQLIGADLQGAMKLADEGPDPKWQGLSSGDVAKLVKGVTRHPVLMRNRRCMRSGLLGFRLLRRAGYDPTLHFALAPDSLHETSTRAHCWVNLDDIPVINEPDLAMVEIYAYPPKAVP